MFLRALAIDLTPLRESPGFRLLYLARVASLLVYGILGVAMNLQVYELTQSSLQVALVTVTTAVPMGVFLIWGGILADRTDRRLLLVRSRRIYVLGILILTVNAALASPSLAAIYAAAFICGATAGISVPALLAVTPTLVGRDQLAAASALTAVAAQIGAVGGPMLAGLVIAGPGLVPCYIVVLVGASTTAVLLARLPSLPPDGAREQSGAAAFVEGLLFLRGSPIVRGLLLIDAAAMIFAMPFALLPQIGMDMLAGGPTLTGFLYASPAVGSLIGALTSGWTGRTHRPGAALVAAVCLWGLAAIGLGLSGAFWTAAACLALLGFADIVSEILRGALLQRHTPDALLGRVSSLWMMQATASPALGNIQAGIVARLFSPAIALVCGGCASLVATAAVAAAIPAVARARK